MATYNKFDSFTENLAEKVHNLGVDDLRIALTNSAPIASNTILANITQIANGNGYTTGGDAVSISSSDQSAVIGTYRLVLGDLTFTAGPSSMGPFRYAVLYNNTATNDELIGWWDYGSAVTLASGETFTVDFDATTGVIQIV